MNFKIDFFSIIRKYDILIGSGGIVCVSIFLGFFFLRPNIGKAREIISQKTGLEAKLVQLKKKDSALSELDIAFYKDTFPKLTTVLPQSKDFVSLFSTFDQLQEKTGVSILRTDFQLGSVSTASAARQMRQPGIPAFIVPMRLDVAGSHEQLKQFFAGLSDLSGRYIVVEGVQWNMLDNGMLKASLTAKAFYYPLPNKIGSIDAPLPQMGKDQLELLTKISQLQLIQDNDDQYSDITTGKKDLFK